MRVGRFLLLVVLGVSFLLPSFAQQTASTSSAAQYLQRALAALTGSVALTDVTLSGIARRIAGSDDETGTATVKALAAGAMRLDFSFPSGTRGEVRANSPDGPSGDWSGSDGVSHSIALHNLSTDWGWFPAFTLSNLNSSPNTVATYVGQETRNGHSVQHLSVKRQFPSQKGNVASLMQHLSQMDMYIDAATLLPVSLAYNTHPDNDAGLDIPVEIRFSDYRAINGAKVPYHVQKYLNNSLTLDFQAESVAFNTGLSASAFNAQ